MARERVLIVTARPSDPEGLAALVRAIADAKSWPSVLAVSVDGPDDELVSLLAAQGGQTTVADAQLPVDEVAIALAGRIDAESIVVLEPEGSALRAAAVEAASVCDIPLWAPATGEPKKRDITLAGTRFSEIGIERPPEARGHIRTGTFWVSTFAAGVLALVVGIAGTFSYLSMPPVGILVSGLAVAGLLVGSRASVPYRTPSAVAAVVLLFTVMLLSADPFGSAASQGSVLVPATPLGWIWIGVVALGSFATLALPDFGAMRRSRMRVREGAAE